MECNKLKSNEKADGGKVGNRRVFIAKSLVWEVARNRLKIRTQLRSEDVAF